MVKKRKRDAAIDLRESVPNLTEVSLSLAKHLISTRPEDANLVFSPLSIQVLLALLAAGSGGPTRHQLLHYLKANSVQELNALSSQILTRVLADGDPLGGPLLSTANGVWVDRSLNFNPDFKGIVQKDYRAAASKRVDFQNKAERVRRKVNTWAEKETNGLIEDLLPSDSVDHKTRIIFANAVYFKGTWNEKFNSSRTKNHKFFLLNGGSLQVPFMTSYQRQLIRAFDGFKVLTLPYKQGEDKRTFSMHLFLPDANDGLPSLVENFGSNPDFIETHLPHSRVKVGDFRVPKFKMSFELEASKVLKGRGLVLPFSPGGFTEMVDSATDGQPLRVSAIYHKAFIEVNEEGTEAAAASMLYMSIHTSCRRRVEEEKIDFVADHPFLFVLREDATGVVIFIGQVCNPSS